MAGKGLAAEEELRPVQGKHRGDVGGHLVVVDGEDRSDGEVLEGPGRGPLLDEPQQLGVLLPVLVDEQDALRGALLAAERKGILVCLGRDVLDLLLHRRAAGGGARSESQRKKSKVVWGGPRVVSSLTHFCGTSGPRIFQSNPASSSLILPRRSVARSSATLELPVNRVFLGSDLLGDGGFNKHGGVGRRGVRQPRDCLAEDCGERTESVSSVSLTSSGARAWCLRRS